MKLLYAWFLAFSFVFGIGLNIGSRMQKSQWKKETIKRGYARYDKLTGKCKWNIIKNDRIKNNDSKRVN